jgi:Holliday junction resolvasome RuvABC DNA-binding subunit
MTVEEQLKELNLKIDILVKLTALQVLGGKKKVEAVEALTELGFTEGQIADLLRTTRGSVHSMRQYVRKQKLKPQTSGTKSRKKPAKKNNTAPKIESQ